MDLGFRGKGVVVTGASRGIGRAIALAFADEGAKLAICARGKEGLDEVAGAIRAKGATVHAVPCDVGDGAALAAFLDGAKGALGQIDVLVNNPSGFGFGDDDASWKVGFDVDVMAAVRATNQVVPWMESNGGGSIIHISSISGRYAGSPAPYAAAKAAMISHGKTASAQLAGKKIRLNVVAPGSIDFPGGFWDNVHKAQPAMYEGTMATIPSGRMGTPEEVANAVVFIASNKASWVTGVCLNVDGGQYPGNV